MRRIAPMYVLLSAVLLISPTSVTAAGDKKPESPDPKVMSAIGSLWAAYVYHTHQELGYLAEAGLKTPKDQTVRQQIQVVTALVKALNHQTDNMLKTPIPEPDKKVLAEMQTINNLLGEQSKELTAYLQTQKEAHFDRFQEVRADSWQRIMKTLKIDEKARGIEKKVKK